jgi:hypothetical protein
MPAGREPRRDDRLESTAAGEEHARAEVRQHDDRALALLVEQLHVRMPGAGRDAPVHVADVVAGLIVARLPIIHAAPAQPRAVSARQRRARRQRPRRPQSGGLPAQRDQVFGVDAKGRLVAARHVRNPGMVSLGNTR